MRVDGCAQGAGSTAWDGFTGHTHPASIRAGPAITC
jgi:hypothetical protein